MANNQTGNGGLRRPESGKVSAWRARYVALYWTYKGVDGRPVEQSETVRVQAQIVQDYIDKNGGELIGWGIHEEPRDRPTAKIGGVVLALMDKAAFAGAHLIYVDAAVETRWREHRFLKNVIRVKKIRNMPVEATRELITHFEKNRADDRARIDSAALLRKRQILARKKGEKISHGVKVAIQRGSTPGLLTQRADEIRDKARAARERNKQQFHADLLNFIGNLKEPAGSYNKLVEILNSDNRRTRNGKEWTVDNLRKALKQVDELQTQAGRYVVGAPKLQ